MARADCRLLARQDFLAINFDFSAKDGKEYVRATAFSRCENAMAYAYTWSRNFGGRRSQVWCGAWKLFDSDEFSDLTLKYRCAPEAPGFYEIVITPDDQVVYRLQGNE